MSLLGVVRNGTDPGCSDTSSRSFDMEIAKKTNPTLPLTKAGKVVTIKDSPYHGLNLCLGTLSEMLDEPLRRDAFVYGYIAASIKAAGRQLNS